MGMFSRGEFLCNDSCGEPIHVGDMIFHKVSGADFARDTFTVAGDTYIVTEKNRTWFIDNVSACKDKQK